MKTTIKSRILPVVLTLMLLIGLTTVTAYAEDFNSGSNVDAFNWYSGNVSDTDLSYTAGSGTITWTASTNTLTLNNATVSASPVQISFPSSGLGTQINLVLEGNNVFTGLTTEIDTSGCTVRISGSGNLTMQNTTSGFSVHNGGELIFDGTGKVNVVGTGTTALDIMSGGKVTVNSGDVEFSTANGFGKAIKIQSGSSLTVNSGSLTARMDKDTSYYDSGAICCDASTSSIAINGGNVIVSSSTTGIKLKSATTFKGNAQVYVTSKSKAAIGGAAITITDNATVTAISESDAALSGVVEISGNAVVDADGGTYGISGMYGTAFVMNGNPQITAKGGKHAFNISSKINTAGYAVKVGTDKTGSDAAAWDLTTSFTNYGNSYKYAYISVCPHTNAADDGDCTTAVICPDCGAIITAAYETHDVAEWTSDNNATCTADGTKHGFCTRCLKEVTVADIGSMLPHTIEHFETAPATCTTPGNLEYWYCSVCEKYFSNKECTEEISYEQTIIQHKGHSLTFVKSKEPTCTAAGNNEYWYCSSCKKYFDDAAATIDISPESTVIPAKGHKIDVRYVRPATCELEGNSGELYCTVCGQIISTNNIIPKLGHSFVDGICIVCGAIDPDYAEAPYISKGAGRTWITGSTVDLEFTSTAEFAGFISVWVDGEALDASYYTVREGSTIVTLKASYLDTLSFGKHTIGVVSTNGTAQADFYVTDEGEEITVEDPVEGGVCLSSSDSVDSAASGIAIVTVASALILIGFAAARKLRIKG